MPISATTELLGEHPELLDIAIADIEDGQITSWVRGGDGLIGFGVYKSHTVKGPDRFEKARSWWRAEINSLNIANNSHGLGSGPILFTSFSFDEAEDSILIIPRVVVGQSNGKSWITWIGDGLQPKLENSEEQVRPLNISWSGSNGDIWRERVALAIGKIKDAKLDKVVLARFLTGKSEEQIDVRRLLRLLAKEYPSTWVYSNSGLVGATPELLVRLSKSLITSRVLAGTIRKTGEDERDLALAGLSLIHI